MNTLNYQSLRLPLYDSLPVRKHRERFRRDAVPALHLANSFYMPSGRWPARGYILVDRKSYDQLDRRSRSIDLDIGGTVLLRNLSIVQAQCVTRGIAASAEALYLVELTDDRGILWNEWFSCPTKSNQVGYNCRSPAYPQQYYANTLNLGTPWTWSTMVEDLWTAMKNSPSTGTLLNTFPNLPTAPTSAPENWWCPGLAAWPFMCSVLEYLGMTIAVDLTLVNNSRYTIVESGSSASDLAAFQAENDHHLEDDLEWIDEGAARAPASVTVFFKRRNEYFGTEETVKRTDSQYYTPMFYSTVVTSPVTVAGACGQHFLWDDFTVRYDVDGSPLAADVAQAQGIAAERVAQYFKRMYQTFGYFSQTYAGALQVTAGSLVDCVCWSQDYRNQDRQSWKTTIVRGTDPPFPGLWDSLRR